MLLKQHKITCVGGDVPPPMLQFGEVVVEGGGEDGEGGRLPAYMLRNLTTPRVEGNTVFVALLQIKACFSSKLGHSHHSTTTLL